MNFTLIKYTVANFISLLPLTAATLLIGCGNASSKFHYDPGAANRRDVRFQNKTLVNQCAQTSSPSRTVQVYGISYSEYGANDIAYFISRLENGFQITSRIGLLIDSVRTSPQRAREMLEQTQACMPQIQEVYKRYDLFLNLDFEINTPGVSLVDNVVALSDSDGRSNAHKWYMEDPDFCLTMLHEVSHLLTLHDEYPDSARPNRFVSTEINPASIMNNTYYGFEYVDLYPRHIKQILDPFCYSSQGGPPQGLFYREI